MIVLLSCILCAFLALVLDYGLKFNLHLDICTRNPQLTIV